HFEANGVLVQPSYQSKYPPGQSLALAFGQILTGRPVFGVWISLALACAALCWMLQAWLPPQWALLGGLLASGHSGIIRWWGGTYMGGAVAMLGGALLFGGLRRLFEHRRVSDGVWVALGLALLANSRPFEGLAASLPAGIVLLSWILFGSNHSVQRPPAQA